MKKVRGSSRNRRRATMMRAIEKTMLVFVLLQAASFSALCGEYFTVNLAPPPYPGELLADSPFGINTAIFRGEPNENNRLELMQEAGIKWARQDFTWRRIEVKPGVYKWEYYDGVVDELLAHGIMILAEVAYYDVLGVERVVRLHERMGALPVPLTPSPIYLVGRKALNLRVVPSPGW